MLKWKCLFIAFVLCFISQFIYAQQFEMIHDGVTRTYVVYEPNNLEANPNGYPLIVALHGAGSDGITMIGTAFLGQKATKEKFIVASPDSLRYPMAWWNAGDGYEEITGGTDDLGFISALIDKMIAEYNIDPTRVYIMAHSNGSMMAYRVVAELSHKIAAMAVNSGQMVYDFEKCNPEYSVPIMHFHGLEDPICPFEGGENEQIILPPVEDVIEFWSQLNDCYSNPYTILDSNGILGRKWDSFDGNGDVIFYTIEGWGHPWPRKDEPGIDTTDVMWDFLKQYRRVIEIDSNDWYVDPNGSNTGDGSQENPWDLITAFSHGSISPGDTVWLNGGLYTGPFTKDSNLAGTEYAPIKYRAMPGQRVILTTYDPNNPALMNKADYIWFWGIEISGENLEHTDIYDVSGIKQESVTGAKYINMIVHDWSNGSGFDTGFNGTELSGCISYRNYKGFYGLNDVNDSSENFPWLRYYDCIAFDNNRNDFIHIGESHQLSNILHRGCVAYGNTILPEFLLGSNQFDDNLVMQECFSYSPPDSSTNTSVWWTARSPMDGVVTIENNTFVGGGHGTTIDGWEQITFTGNLCYTADGYLLDIGITGDVSNCTINENIYFQGSDKFCYNEGVHYNTLESWQAATGWDANSIQISGRPDAPWINLRVNKYEPGRAHLIVYDWPKFETIIVDMNDLWPQDGTLEEGQEYRYRIVNVEDIWGEPVVEEFLTDGSIVVPMQGIYSPECVCYIVTREIID
ncbi:MAG: hypothetical protein JXA96_10845 [Sedimentisphaerales bacterium]|nr:hypothetical protein [Sedimentisphaerales bacterium]